MEADAILKPLKAIAKSVGELIGKAAKKIKGFTKTVVGLLKTAKSWIKNAAWVVTEKFVKKINGWLDNFASMILKSEKEYAYAGVKNAAKESTEDTAEKSIKQEIADRVAKEGASGAKNISNDILESPRVGSALKNDPYHAFNDIIDNSAGMATKSSLGNNASLYQLEGSLNGVKGRFEWIVQNGNTTHRMFVPNGTMNGVPIQK